jgi:ATPase associated with various cellular activities AAA_5
MNITEPQPITTELRLERRVLESYYAPDAADRTTDGVVELMAGLQESMQAVRADWRTATAGDRQYLERLAAPHIARINESRRQTNLEEPDVQASEVGENFLLGLAEPNWEEYMPRDTSDEELQRWETFKDEHPDVADNLEDWYMCHAKLHELRKDAGLMERFDEEYRGEQMAATRAAAEFLRAQGRKQDISQQMANIRAKAAKTDRPLTVGERRRIAALQKQLSEVDENIDIPPNSSKEKFLEEVTRLQVREWKRQLDSGLLMTEQMQTIIDETLPAMMRGEPTLFIGETGGAKTALAEYMVRRYCGVEPEFISAYGDVNSYQLMGKQELREENGASVSEFVPGPIIRAMEQGKPLILDEINAMPPELLKRLNKIMQLRPGDRFTIQEDSGKVVEVQPGFCIVATANEKSKRYKGVDDLSVEFQNRFGANINRVRYPDHDKSYDEYPRENAQLAMAAVATERGELPPEIDERDFEDFVRAARLSQQIFSGTNGEGYNQFIDTEEMVDDRPGLEETVLAPRTMVDILHKVAGSYGVVSLKRACQTFLDGIKNQNDRKVMHHILKYHDLLPEEMLRKTSEEAGDNEETVGS